MDKLIKKALEKVKEVRLLIDKLIKADEDEDYLTSEALKEVYKVIYRDTNVLVTKLLECESEDELMTDILSGYDIFDEETFDRTTLCFLIASRQRDENKETVFIEENNGFLYSIYLWYLKIAEMSEEEKEELHKFINLRVTQSSALRQYFAGNSERIKDLCDPDFNFGIMAELLAERAYYSILSSTIKDSNGVEMFEGIDAYEPHLEGRKKLLELEFTAICAEMINRNVTFPCIEEPVSDFTKGIMRESSELANKYMALRKTK